MKRKKRSKFRALFTLQNKQQNFKYDKENSLASFFCHFWKLQKTWVVGQKHITTSKWFKYSTCFDKKKLNFKIVFSGLNCYFKLKFTQFTVTAIT